MTVSRSLAWLAPTGVIFLAWLATGCASRQGSTPAKTSFRTLLTYPPTVKQEVADDYHGTKVADPYRWLEDDNSPETKAWVEAQNKVTFGYLAGIKERPGIKDRLTKLWNFERYTPPQARGGRYFFTRNDGLQNQNVLYWAASLAAEPRVLLDPNKLSADGTVALTSFDVSQDGARIVYGLSTAGSDWQEWRVRDVASGEDLPDVVKWAKFSGASWSKDGKGFFYSRYDEPKPGDALKGVNYFHKVCYHALGAPQSDDRLVYHNPDQKEWLFQGEVTEDGHYLVIRVRRGTDRKNRVFYLDLATEGARVVELLNKQDASYDFVDNDGTTFYFLTSLDAPRGRLIAIDVANPAPEAWTELVKETGDSLEAVTSTGGLFFAEYLHDASSAIKVFDRAGQLVRTVELPGLGKASGFAGQRDAKETFYSFTSFTVPTRIYRYDIGTGKSEVFKTPNVDFAAADYETKQVFYQSKDGTRVPMFITHKKGLRLDGQNPTYLYGYGGFNISLTPGFSVANAVWLEMGGVYALANLRGGGEYGKAWHEAGTKLQKQNVFDDFLGAAQWLVDNKYTSPRRLAIGGGSNGGLLVGACMTQRPDLFAAALPAVGVLDMLRFHKFTIGWAWTSDYGCADNADEFKALYAYSPLHRLAKGTTYPSTLITTADHDDRVVPAHSFKFAAALQAAHQGINPVLIRIETKAGHGAGKPVAKIIEEAADRWAFLVRELEMEP